MDLEYIVRQLNARKQRATYGAVAGIVGGLARGLMNGRPKTPEYSWVVAKSDGRPTGYTNHQIHPDCLRSIVERPGDVIADPERLKAWLKGPATAPKFWQH
jgi:hypothetical protein